MIVETDTRPEVQAQNTEGLKLLEIHTTITDYSLLSSPPPNIPYRVGEEVRARRASNTREAKEFAKQWGDDKWAILEIADKAEQNEWGITTWQKTWGYIDIQGRNASFETQAERDPSIAYLVEDSSDASPLSEVLGKYPEYTQKELDRMAKRGIKGVVTTRTGDIRHYRDGDSLLVHNQRGVAVEHRWHQIPL